MKVHATLGVAAVLTTAAFWAAGNGSAVAQNSANGSRPPAAGGEAAASPAALSSSQPEPPGARQPSARPGLQPETVQRFGGGGDGVPGPGRMPLPPGFIKRHGGGIEVTGGGIEVYSGRSPFGGTGPEEAASEELQRLRSLDRDLEGETNDIYQTYIVGDGTAKAALQERLADVLRRQFDSRQRIRDLELTELEEQVERLRELHGRRENAKDEIVRARLDQLVRSADGLGWDTDAVARPQER